MAKASFFMSKGSGSKRQDFVHAWYAWQHVSLPTDNFRLRRRDSALEGIEYELDHIRSHVHLLGLDFLEGKALEYGQLVKEERSKLEKALKELASLPIAEVAKGPYRAFVVATQELLGAIGDSHQRGDLGRTELEPDSGPTRRCSRPLKRAAAERQSR
jgi:hypothetical protein